MAIKFVQTRLLRLRTFSLRSIMLAVTAFGVWLGLHWHSVRQQRAAVEVVRRLGGEVWYDYEVAAAGPLGGSAESSVPAVLLDVLGRDHFHDVVTVNTTGHGSDPQRNLSDYSSVHVHLEGLPKLEYLYLGQLDKVDDAGVQEICKLKRLQGLMLQGESLTSIGMAELGGLEQLKWLTLFRSNVSDGDMRVLHPEIVSLSDAFFGT